jgi:hypothetical protein
VIDMDSKKKVGDQVISTTIGDDRMTSTGTRHEAMVAPGVDQYEPGAWSVTWLPGVRLDRNQAITAMTLAEYVDSGVVGSSVMRGWAFVQGWAKELDLSAEDAVDLITRHSHTVVWLSRIYGTGQFTEFHREEFDSGDITYLSGWSDDEIEDHLTALLGRARHVGEGVRVKVYDSTGTEIAGSALPGRWPSRVEVWSALDQARAELYDTGWHGVLTRLLQHSVIITALEKLSDLYTNTPMEHWGADPCGQVIDQVRAELPTWTWFPAMPDWFKSYVLLTDGEVQRHHYTAVLAFATCVEAALAAVANEHRPAFPGTDLLPGEHEVYSVERVPVYTFDNRPVVPAELDLTLANGWLLKGAAQFMDWARDGVAIMAELDTVEDIDTGEMHRVGPAEHQIDEYHQAEQQTAEWDTALLDWATGGAYFLVTGLRDRLTRLTR